MKRNRMAALILSAFIGGQMIAPGSSKITLAPRNDAVVHKNIISTEQIQEEEMDNPELTETMKEGLQKITFILAWIALYI